MTAGAPAHKALVPKKTLVLHKTLVHGAVLLLAVLSLALLLAGCTQDSAPHEFHSKARPAVEQRDGYIVDHRHPAQGHSSRVHFLVLHYTDENQANSLRILTGPHVSSHYLVTLPTRHLQNQPVILQLVDESRRAWHAGDSRWGQRNRLNDTSIGIEIVNAGPNRSWVGSDAPDITPPELEWMAYPNPQIDALIALARDIIKRHHIPPQHVLAHSDIAPERKLDPGPAFPWKRLHDAGVGAWPEPERVDHYRARFAAAPIDLATLQQALVAWGYRLEISGELDDATRATLRAFQMHFRPTDYRGLPDTETSAILWALLERYQNDAWQKLDS